MRMRRGSSRRRTIQATPTAVVVGGGGRDIKTGGRPAAVGFCDSPIDPRWIFLLSLSLVPYLAISAVLSDIKRGQATDWAGGLRLLLL